jgi:hypothetical protein
VRVTCHSNQIARLIDQRIRSMRVALAWRRAWRWFGVGLELVPRALVNWITGRRRGATSAADKMPKHGDASVCMLSSICEVCLSWLAVYIFLFEGNHLLLGLQPRTTDLR